MKSNIKRSYRKVLRKLSNITHPDLGSKRRVLLGCSSTMMAMFLRDVYDLLINDPRIDLYVTFPEEEDRPGGHEIIRKKLPVREISLKRANISNWDMVVVADYGFYSLTNPDDYPVVRIPHGITGKILGGNEYQYGKMMYNKDGRLGYTRIFEASDANRERIINAVPEVKDVVVTVGSMLADKALIHSHRRDEYREQFGFKADEQVVFVMSTWGEHSVFHRYGDALIDEMKELLSENYRFILSAHPIEYKPREDGKRVWGEYLRELTKEGFDYRDCSDDWPPYMAASDILLTDHTSLALFGAVLSKPAIYTDFPDELIVEGSYTWKFRELSPIFKEADQLRDCLERAAKSYPTDRLKNLAGDITSYPGEAFERVSREIYELLGLPLPAEANDEKGPSESQADL